MNDSIRSFFLYAGQTTSKNPRPLLEHEVLKSERTKRKSIGQTYSSISPSNKVPRTLIQIVPRVGKLTDVYRVHSWKVSRFTILPMTWQCTGVYVDGLPLSAQWPLHDRGGACLERFNFRVPVGSFLLLLFFSAGALFGRTHRLGRSRGQRGSARRAFATCSLVFAATLEFLHARLPACVGNVALQKRWVFADDGSDLNSFAK